MLYILPISLAQVQPANTYEKTRRLDTWSIHYIIIFSKKKSKESLYLIVVGGGAQIANFGKKTSVLYGAIDS